jgi:hypothetical protein
MIEIHFHYRYQSNPFRKIVAWPQVPALGERVTLRHEPGMKLVYAVYSVDWIWDEEMIGNPMIAQVVLS